MATSGLSNDNCPLPLRLRPRESGQLSMIIPQNHGITITYSNPTSHGPIKYIVYNKNVYISVVLVLLLLVIHVVCSSKLF